MRTVHAAIVIVSMMLGASAANAQTATPGAKWPDRPLRFIVPLPAGSAADVMARLIGQRLSERIGQPIIAENRAGASGILGADVVAKGAPDGYMLGIATSTTHVTAPIFNTKMPFDPVNDFAPVALVGISPYVLVVSPTLPVNTVADVVALAKAKPRTLSYSSVGHASQAISRWSCSRPRPAPNSITSRTRPRPMRSSIWSKAASTCSSVFSAPAWS